MLDTTVQDLERRDLKTDLGLVHTDATPPETLEAGETVQLTSVDLYSLGFGRNGSILKEMSWDAAPGTDLSHSTLIFSDQYGNIVGIDDDGDQVAELSFGRGINIPRRGLHFTVDAIVSEDAPDHRIGLQKPDAEVVTASRLPWWHWGARREMSVRVFHVGAHNPVHEVNAVQQPVSLDVTQLLLSDSDTVVENEVGVHLFSFETRANGGDALFTEAAFVASNGNLLNFSQYSLLADTDGNQVVDTVIETTTVQNDTLVFDDILGGGFVSPEGEAIRYEVHGTVSGNPITEMFQLSFADPVSITGERLDNGGELSDVSVFRTDSTVFDIAPQGDLTVNLSNTSVQPTYLLGGYTETVMRLSLEAHNEPVDVTHLGFRYVGSTTDKSVDRIEICSNDGSTIAFATIAGADAAGDRFGANMQSQQLVIPENGKVELLVKVRIKTDTAGGVSGEIFSLGVGKVAARGLYSGNTLSLNDGDSEWDGEILVGTHVPAPDQFVSGQQFHVTMSRPSGVENVGDPDGSAIPVGPFSEIAAFRVSADQHSNSKNGLNDVVIDNLSFIVRSSGVNIDMGSFALYNKDNSIIKAYDYTYEDLGDGRFRITFDSISASAVDTTIGEGEDVVFGLQVSIFSYEEDAFLQVSFDSEETDWTDHDASFADPQFINGLILGTPLEEGTLFVA